MSGTSCATPIAAAYAAMVLDFVKSVKLSDVDDAARDELVRKLKRVKTMKHIFWSQMVERRGTLGKFNVVKPGLLFAAKRDGKPSSDSEVFSKLKNGIDEAGNSTFLH